LSDAEAILTPQERHISMQHLRFPIRVSLGVALALVAVGSTARAERPRTVQDQPLSEPGYGYVFTDDVMQAGAFTPDDPRIVVAGHATRVMLIRPRTAFVVELLRSVENL
jgi:hypothetical protein